MKRVLVTGSIRREYDPAVMADVTTITILHDTGDLERPNYSRARVAHTPDEAYSGSDALNESFASLDRLAREQEAGTR